MPAMEDQVVADAADDNAVMDEEDGVGVVGGRHAVVCARWTYERGGGGGGRGRCIDLFSRH
jgi:hypothetical protein